MTEKRNIPEQMASHNYWSDTQQFSEQSVPERRAPAAHIPAAAQRQRRVVSVPEEDPVMAWQTYEQRKEQQRRKRSRSQEHVNVVPRTLAQTGMRASSGRLHTVHHTAPTHHSPIPVRSGRRTLRRGVLWKLLGMLAVIALVAVGSTFLLSSSTFRIAQINVLGTRNDRLIHTIQHIGVQGQNIFLLDVAGATQRVDALPEVSSATLSKQWPNQVTVTVLERVPVLLWQTAQDTFSIDNQGTVIASLHESGPINYLGTVIDITQGQSGQGGKAKALSTLHPGAHLDATSVKFAHAILQQMPQIVGVSTFKLYYDGTMYGSMTDQSGGKASSKGSYIVVSPDGWKAYLGGPADPNPLGNRLLELREILARAQKEQLTLASIDLRYGQRPVFTV